MAKDQNAFEPGFPVEHGHSIRKDGLLALERAQGTAKALVLRWGLDEDQGLSPSMVNALAQNIARDLRQAQIAYGDA